ncbi:MULTISPECIES: hypothetical protein [Virgibacillus]|uniref:Uncharacterized protein n=1 Tax=Virgibacillus dokdonensis TaxID=302167 RepID=A0A2K9IZR9_9BACI|nr:MULTISPECIES: hypothetical protein [Virgibacillus]AUJ24954.1 hypothetical protein A21D_01873 [Virgibacillus dokdonensis]NWO12122.1 hypothetical protein [Virgibacillus sp.]
MAKQFVAMLGGVIFTMVIISIIVDELLWGSLIGFAVGVGLMYLFLKIMKRKS